MTEEQQKSLDDVDSCMKYLGSSLNLTDPFGSLSPKRDIDELTTKGWNAIREDYRKLSDAIHVLREQLNVVPKRGAR